MADNSDGSGVQQNFESRADVRDEAGLVGMWLAALDAASDEEQDWRTESELVVKRYRQEEATTSTTTPVAGSDYFNILYSSIQTIVPAIYNSPPIPDVRRRFNDPDKAAKYGAQMIERCLQVLLDGYNFDAVMTAAVLDMELAGRGVTRVDYDYYPGEVDPATGQPKPPKQTARCDHVGWADFRHGPAQRWADVPWIAFQHFYTRENLYGVCDSEAVADQVRLDVEVAKGKPSEIDLPPPDIFMRARVWEIWDKPARQVLFIAPSYKDAPLKRAPDPYGFAEFFPVPMPLYAIETTDTLVPIPPYRQYQKQAEELDILTERIMKLTRALRWRGIYDSSITEFTKLASADDGDLVPMQNAQALYAQAGGLEKAVYMLPIQELVITLEKLTQQREIIKQNIFELTGSADIMRGQTDPRETKGAQQIKAQWGSLRVQMKQRAVQRYAADLLNLKAKIISKQFSTQTILKMSNMELPTMQEKQQTMQQVQRQRMMQQAMQQRQLQQSVPGRPAAPGGNGMMAPAGMA